MESNASNSLMVKAPNGLHDHVLEIVSCYFDKNNRILDIAAGSGAMSKRLFHSGYEHLVANDINKNEFNAHEVQFMTIDLNGNFSENFGHSSFDAILAVEIIEHIQNPYKFITECNKILKDNGHLLISTPNVLGSEAIMQMIKNRQLLYFSEAAYSELGHISILPDWLLNKHLVLNGFSVILKTYTDRLLPRKLSFRPIKIAGSLLLKVLDFIAFLFARSKQETVGTNYIVLAKKNEVV